MRPFSIVVPLIPQHDNEILRLFKTLSVQQDYIEEIYLCRSESRLPLFLLNRKFEAMATAAKLSVPIILDLVSGVARDGENRNRGWMRSRAKYVVFLDADDSYSNTMLSEIYKCCSQYEPDAIIHDYNPENNFSESDITQSKVLSERVNLAKTKHPREEFYEVVGEQETPLRIHFAHVTIKNSVKDDLKFSSRFPAADKEMTQILIKRGYSVYYINAALSGWSRNRSFRYRIRLFKNKLS